MKRVSTTTNLFNGIFPVRASQPHIAHISLFKVKLLLFLLTLFFTRCHKHDPVLPFYVLDLEEVIIVQMTGEVRQGLVVWVVDDDGSQFGAWTSVLGYGTETDHGERLWGLVHVDDSNRYVNLFVT